MAKLHRGSHMVAQLGERCVHIDPMSPHTIIIIVLPCNCTAPQLRGYGILLGGEAIARASLNSAVRRVAHAHYDTLRSYKT